jgi:hypothetical protein
MVAWQNLHLAKPWTRLHNNAPPVARVPTRYEFRAHWKVSVGGVAFARNRGDEITDPFVIRLCLENGAPIEARYD